MIHVNRDANNRKSTNYKLSLLQYPLPSPPPPAPLLAEQNMQAKEVYFYHPYCLNQLGTVKDNWL